MYLFSGKKSREERRIQGGLIACYGSIGNKKSHRKAKYTKI
jgi:hypothetical protein